LTVWLFYSDEASPFLRIELPYVPQVGSPVRIEHGSYIYSGTVVKVQWHFAYAGERMRTGGEVNVHLIVERSATVV
jgi:hypothetical protein